MPKKKSHRGRGRKRKAPPQHQERKRKRRRVNKSTKLAENDDMRAERRREEATASFVEGDLPPLPEEDLNAADGMQWETDSMTTMDTDITSISIATTADAGNPKKHRTRDGTSGVEAQEEEPEDDSEEPTLSEYRQVRGAPENFELEPTEADDVTDHRHVVQVYYYDGQDVYYWQGGLWKRSTRDRDWFIKWPLASIEQVEATGPVPTSTHVDTDETYEAMWERQATDDDAVDDEHLDTVDEEHLDTVDEEREAKPSDSTQPPPRKRWKRNLDCRNVKAQRADEVALDAAAYSKDALDDARWADEVALEQAGAAAPLHMNSSAAERDSWSTSIADLPEVEVDDMDEEEWREWLQRKDGTKEEKARRAIHRLAQKTDVTQVLKYADLLRKEQEGATLTNKERKSLNRMKAMREGDADDDVRYATEVIDDALKAWRKKAEVIWTYYLEYVDSHGGRSKFIDAQGPTTRGIKAFLVYARRRHPDSRYKKKKKFGLKMSTVNNWKNMLSSCIKDRIEGVAGHRKHPKWRNRALARSISKWIKSEWLEGLRQGTDQPKQAIALTEEQLAKLSANCEVVLGRVLGIKTRAILLTMLHCLYRYQDIKLIQWDKVDVKKHPITLEDMWCLLVEEPTKADEEKKMRWITDSYASYWTCAATHLARWAEVSPTLVGNMFPREGNCWEPIPYATLMDRIRRVAKATPGLEDFIDNLTLHTYRRSGAQIYITRGGTIEHLMVAGGWRSNCVKRYLNGAMSGGLFSVSCVLSGSSAAVPKNRSDYTKYVCKMNRLHKEVTVEQSRAERAETRVSQLQHKHTTELKAARDEAQDLRTMLSNLRLEVSCLKSRLNE